VIGRDGGRVPANDWFQETSHGIQFDLANYHGPIAIFTGVEQVLDMAEFEDRSSEAIDEARGRRACPPTCMHCPEQAVMFCATVCGF
jgi:hypothetical protein